MKITFSGVSKTFRIRIQNGLRGFLRPEYKEVHALSDVSFSLGTGVTGLIGENGAGKSTTIKLLTGILSPSAGEIRLLGKDPFLHRKELMRRVAVIFGQRSLLAKFIPVRYSYEWLRDIYGVHRRDYEERLETLTEHFGITELIERAPRELSLGQRRRCDLVGALLHAPEVFLLDEPTIGLDFRAKSSLRKLLRSYVESHEITVLISSHDLPELENLCDDYIVLSGGRLLHRGTKEELEQNLGLSNVVEFCYEAGDLGAVVQELEERGFITGQVEGRLRVYYHQGVDEIVRVVYNGLRVSDIKLEQNSLQRILEG